MNKDLREALAALFMIAALFCAASAFKDWLRSVIREAVREAQPPAESSEPSSSVSREKGQ